MFALSSPPQINGRQAAEARSKALLDDQSAMIDATDLAEAKGRVEGKAWCEANTSKKFVPAMCRQGMSAGAIFHATLPSTETIQSIIDD